MRVGDNQQIQASRSPLRRFRHACDGIAAVAHHEHALDVVGLGNLVFRQQRCIMPTGRRNAWRDSSAAGVVEAAFQTTRSLLPRHGDQCRHAGSARP